MENNVTQSKSISDLLPIESNVINLKDKELTMSSREIAELCEKRHDHVLRDIRRQFKEIGNAPKSGVVKYKDAKGEMRDEYLLTKRDTLILISGYNIELRARIIDRWQELESRLVEHRLPTNFVEALEMLVVAEKDKLLLQAKVEKDKPLVVMAEALMESDVGMKMQEWARIQSDATGIGRNKLYGQLREWSIFDKNSKPLQRCINAGWFYIIERAFDTGNFSGINQIVMITPKGQKYLANKLTNNQ